MKREPTEKELEEIAGAITTGDRIEATNLYISISGCGLTEAQKFITTMTNELRATKPEKFTRKKTKQHLFGKF